MYSIFKKELNLFFATPIGYLVIGIFLLFSGLFLWVFKGEFNILDAGFADMNSFFMITPWFLLFLIPAITMRSFSDEIRSGTIEIIKTKPLGSWEILLGKYLGCLFLVLLALIPTLSYVFTLLRLTESPEGMDMGTVLGSYVGLLLLASSIASIGVYTSTLSTNQIVAFILGIALSFLLYYGPEAINDLYTSSSLNWDRFGMHGRFKSVARGVIDSRDLVYFISISVLFLYLSKNQLDRH